MISQRYRWRNENREAYNAYQAGLMRRRRADAKAGASAGQLIFELLAS
jgi:hypothetical protein